MTIGPNRTDVLASAFRCLRDGDARGALALVRERLAGQPDDPRAYALMARAHAALGDAPAARASVDRALALDPDSVPALVEEAALARQDADVARLRAALERLVRLAPGVADFAYDLGMLDLAEDRYDAATTSLSRASALRPRWIEPLHALATLCLRQGRVQDAIAIFHRCLALDADHVPSLEGMATARRRAGSEADLQAMIQARLRVAALQPDSVDAQFRVANAYRCVERFADAAQWYDRLLALEPHNLTARWARFQHPPSLVHADANAEAAFLAQWRAGLAYFEQVPIEEISQRGFLGPVLTNATNFYLHYLGEGFLDEQRRHARVVERMARTLLPGMVEPLRPSEPRTRMRVGFVSGFLRQHTVTKLMGALIRGLDRSRFEVCAFNVDENEDSTTQILRAQVDRFEGGERDPAAWARLLREAGLDALVYLDIGMHPIVQTLAAFRFAPLQCVLWGHPVTSGFEHVDWFLSAADMEAPGAQAHYTERLALLPGIGTCFEPPSRAPDPDFVSPARSGPDTVHFLFVQSVHKIRPLHDDLLARIAARAPQARFSMVPFQREHVREDLAARMRGAFAARGLDFARHVHILPFLDISRFLALARDADLNLDTIGWSGGNTTLEISWFDVPTITLPGSLMRSRHSAAMMRAVGLDELVVASEDEWVELAVALAHDRPRREALRARLRERKHVLYRDQRVVEAFQRFLLDPASLAV